MLTIKQRIESIITNIDRLPSFPEVASRVLNMVSDPNVSFKLIAEEIAKDQAMTTNILKLCNSAYFSKGKEINSIDRAIVTLGLKEVKDIVIMIAAKPVLNTAVIGYDLNKGDLWKQSLVVATISKSLAQSKGRKDIGDIVFTGGLIHNVGKVVLALFVQNTFRKIIEAVHTKNITFNHAEREIMGFDHQEVGDKILDKWKFPHLLKSIVRYYLEPQDAPAADRVHVSFVHIAYVVSIMAGIGVGSDGLYHELNETAVKTTGLTNEEIEEQYSKMPNIIKQVEELL